MEPYNPEPKHETTANTVLGPIIGVVIIVVVLLLGAWYLWENNQGTSTTSPTTTTVTAPADISSTNQSSYEPSYEFAAEIASINTISETTDLATIEAEVAATSLDSLDRELPIIKTLLETATQ